jgi:hypothetical protein
MRLLGTIRAYRDVRPNQRIRGIRQAIPSLSRVVASSPFVRKDITTMISIYLVSRKVLAPVIEYYRIAVDSKAFDTDKALHAHFLSEISALSKSEDSNAVAVDSQVLPYDEKANPPIIVSAKAENPAIASASAEAMKRSIIEAKKKAVELTKTAKEEKASRK